ncbi:ABC transporter permease [Olivibacter domesticus]|uniref:Putative ABC transport system permease protein n=1 Tax=Olivibacter domesticus TaxID=407022 RepID=A0A1H7SHP3_OLID1|nr:ABC transporter permease [Olivibacter domesticus]SEL70987.1 putative ABC transport system permease protein [Olivibacter domesticus]
MLKHYLKTTLRYLFENKRFSIINIFGLAVALCIVYLIFFFVRFELSYDQFNKNVDRIYRISTDIKGATGVNQETSAPALAIALERNFPEVEKAGRFLLDYYIISKEHENFGEETLAYADSSIFSIFSFPLLRGNVATALNAPFNIVLSETAAKKYFGTTDCLNQTLTLDGKHPATVTGIMKDIPSNSHFRTDILLSMSTLFSSPNASYSTEDWKKFGFSTYLLLKDNTNIKQFQQKIDAFAKIIPIDSKLEYRFVLEPLADLYHHGSLRGNKAGSTTVGNYTNIYVFSFIALFVLCIACFNYINLTTALSIKRAKEIGVRQMMGATKKQLTLQFFMDAILLATLAFLVSIVLCGIAIPWFHILTGKTIIDDIKTYIAYLPYALSIALLTGLLSGIYPAFFLSRFKPTATLKGRFIVSSKGQDLRKSLVIIQFVIFILLTVSTLVVYRQLNFMRNENLGFKKAHNLVIDFHYDERIREHQDQVKQALTEIAGIEQASFSAYIPGKPNRQFATTMEGKNGMMEEFQSDVYFIDDAFLKQYDIQVIAGRGFSKASPEDLRKTMLINESCLARLGYANPQDIIGKRFSQRGGTGEVIGVVKDFHFHSMHEEIQPLTMQISPGFFTFLTLSISSEHIPETIKAIEQKWHHIAPGLPLIYYFADEAFNAQYQAEERFGRLFISFSICSIFISCLGLLGLVSFNTLQRTKEIGIRKVLGASSAHIFTLLTKEYIFLVGIAFLLAIPLTWVVMNQWLKDFAYRIQVQWWMFLITGFAAIVIALLTVGFLALRTAVANPVKSLKDE